MKMYLAALMPVVALQLTAQSDEAPRKLDVTTLAFVAMGVNTKNAVGEMRNLALFLLTRL